MRKPRLTAILVIGLASTAHGENWPNWRGPSAAGVSLETGLPVRWSDTENVAWKAHFRGLGIWLPIVGGTGSSSRPRSAAANRAADILAPGFQREQNSLCAGNNGLILSVQRPCEGPASNRIS